jgi:hypothetical protein
MSQENNYYTELLHFTLWAIGISLRVSDVTKRHPLIIELLQANFYNFSLFSDNFKNCYLSESEAEANWSVKNLIGNNLVNELPIFEQKIHRNNV